MTSEDTGFFAFETRSIHTGRDPNNSSTPIHMASTGRTHYTRISNPTNDAFEASIASLEGAAGAVSSACGQSAIVQTLLPLLASGDRIVAHRQVYDWTDTFLREEAPKFGVTTEMIDLRDAAALRRALEKPAKIVYFEALTNPALEVIDVKTVADIAHAAGALVVVDNTFLSPAVLRPLEFGADLVLHSATKYLCGHGDAMGGVTAARDPKLLDALRRGRAIYGGVISPFNSFLILRGITTLALRMRQHGENALRVAQFLSTHAAVAEVRYPGLPSDPGHAAARTWTNGFGGMVGFVIKGGPAAQQTFCGALKLCRPWVSLGDTETLIYARRAESRKDVPEGYIRVSIGLENTADLVADLDQALKKAIAATR